MSVPEHASAGKNRAARPAEQLVARARRGDSVAFRELYSSYCSMVHGVLIATAPAQEVDDLMQDVFLSAWRGLGGLREAGHVGAWLASIARNRAYRFHARGPQPAEPLPEEIVEEPGQVDESETILACLRELPEAYRETLALRLVDGLSGPEIAAATGLTHGSVRVNLTRGMKLLRERLSREGWS